MTVSNIKMTGPGAFTATTSDTTIGSVATLAHVGTDPETLAEAAKRAGKLPDGVELVGYHAKRDDVTHSLREDEAGGTLVLATRASSAKTGDKAREVTPADLQALQDKFWTKPKAS